MKKVIFAAILPLMLAGCAPPPQPTVERQDLKTACSSGDFNSCADLGHIEHQDRLTAPPPA